LDAETAAVFATKNGYTPLMVLEAKNASPANKKLFSNVTKLTAAFEAVASSDGFVMSVESMKPFGAKAFSYDVKVDSLVHKRISEGVTAATDALRQEKETLGESIKQCLKISGMEILKNLSGATPNPVRAALVEELNGLNVREAGKVVDYAFAKTGEPLILAIVAKAMELLDKPVAVRNEIAKYVSEATVQPTSTVTASDKVSKDVATSLADGSVDVTATIGDDVDEAELGTSSVYRNLVRSSLHQARRNRA
jgi:hypothetical protein